MSEPRRCPMCIKAEPPRYLVEGRGELEQSGLTHLPTRTWTCECGYKEYEAARGVEWETNTVKNPMTGEVISKPRRTS